MSNLAIHHLQCELDEFDILFAPQNEVSIIEGVPRYIGK